MTTKNYKSFFKADCFRVSEFGHKAFKLIDIMVYKSHKF